MKFGQNGIHAQKCAIISAYKPPLSASLRTSRREIRRKAEDAAEQPPEDGQTALPPEEQPREKEQKPAVQQDIGKVEVSRSDDVHTFWESFRCIRGLRREVRRRGRSSAKERPPLSVRAKAVKTPPKSAKQTSGGRTRDFHGFYAFCGNAARFRRITSGGR